MASKTSPTLVAALTLAAVAATIASAHASPSAKPVVATAAPPVQGVPATTRSQLLPALKAAIAQGFTPTATGEAILAGTYERPKFAVDGAAAGNQIVIAIKPTSSPSVTNAPRKLQGVKHSMGTTYVFLDCGFGITANVTFQYSIESWTVWDQESIVGTDRQVYGNNTTCHCTCLAYAWDVPGANWNDLIAEENETYGDPVHETEWCG